MGQQEATSGHIRPATDHQQTTSRPATDQQQTSKTLRTFFLFSTTAQQQHSLRRLNKLDMDQKENQEHPDEHPDEHQQEYQHQEDQEDQEDPEQAAEERARDGFRALVESLKSLEPLVPGDVVDVQGADRVIIIASSIREAINDLSFFPTDGSVTYLGRELSHALANDGASFLQQCVTTKLNELAVYQDNQDNQSQQLLWVQRTVGVVARLIHLLSDYSNSDLRTACMTNWSSWLVHALRNYHVRDKARERLAMALARHVSLRLVTVHRHVGDFASQLQYVQSQVSDDDIQALRQCLDPACEQEGRLLSFLDTLNL